MIAWTSPDEIFRSTPLTISVPSSRATCRFFNSSVAKRTPKGLPNERFCPSVRGSHRSQAHPDERGSDQPATQPERGPERAGARLRAKPPPGPLVAGQGLEEVVRRADGLVLTGVLPLPAVSEEHEVAGARRELLPPEELLGPPAERQLTHRMLEAVHDALGERLRLVDRRDGLRLLADVLPRHVELRRVDRAREDDRDVDRDLVLAVLDARGL